MQCKFSINRLIVSAIIIAGAMNAVLRLSEESKLTLFRLLLILYIIICPFIFRKIDIKILISRLMIIFTMCLYVVITSMFFSDYTNENLSYLINFIALVVFILIIKNEFNYESYQYWIRFFENFISIIVIYATLESFLGLSLFFNSPSHLGSSVGFYGNENDLSLALSGYILYVYTILRKISTQTILNLILSFLIICSNTSRAALLSIILFSGFVGFHFLESKLNSNYMKITLRTIASLSLLIVPFLTIIPEGEDHFVSIYELVVDPLLNIINNEAELNQIGSQLRLNALIAIFPSYLESLGFGIGLFNTIPIVEVISNGIARSMHIFPIQLLFELGWAIIFILYLIKKYFSTNKGGNYCFIYFILSFFIATMSMSSGAITNYLFFAEMTLFYSYFTVNKFFKC